MALPGSSNFHDGDMVQCSKCARNVRVKFYNRDDVVVVSTQEQKTLALRCQYCGFVMCDSCAHPPESIFPVCPACYREWGPYYFTIDSTAPIIQPEIKVEDKPVETKSGVMEPTLISNTPVQQADFLGSGDIELRDQILIKIRWNKFRVGFYILILVFILSGIIFTVFSPKMAEFRRGIALLSKSPERTPFTEEIFTNTPPVEKTKMTFSQHQEVTPTKTNLNTPTVRLASVMATQLTLSPVVTSSPESTPKWTVTSLPSSPTFPPTLTPTFMPSATATNHVNSVNDDGCVTAVSVGLADEGKNICVYGTVVYTTTQSTAFSIYFSNDNGSFRVIVYDRVPKDIKIGDCVQIMGYISILLDRPVIALRYHDVIGHCSP